MPAPNLFSQMSTAQKIRCFLPLIVLCVVFIGAGAWAIWHIQHKAHERAETIMRLQSEGIHITTNIVDVIEDDHIRMNGRSPFRIYSIWTDPKTGVDHKFVSARIWSNPLYRLGSQKTVTVIIDPDDPNIYFMDLSSVGLGG